MALFAEVAVPVAVRKTFAYAVPARLEPSVRVGVRVLAPFGRKTLTGVVVAVAQEPPAGGFALKPLRDVLDPYPILPPDVVAAALWSAEYYFAPPGETLRAALPAGMAVSADRIARASARAARLVAGGLRPPGLDAFELELVERLAREGETAVAELGGRDKLRTERALERLAADGWIELAETRARPRVSAKQQLAVEALSPSSEALERLTAKQRALHGRIAAAGGPVLLEPLLREAGATAAVGRALEAKGLVRIAPLDIARRPVELSEAAARNEIALVPAQRRALEILTAALGAGEARRFLLHGVTGSGKTEVYLRLIAEVLRRGEGAILLVPEIGLTPLLGRIALSHFPDEVALLHSGLSAGERHDQWQRVRAGRARVVVGTRSAVFAPLASLRLVVLDEEHDTSYKQQESPSYHAREVAWQRVRSTGGVLLMGSATPSIETYHAARSGGAVGYLALPERIHARPMPEVTVVDMSLEFQRRGKTTVLSDALVHGLDECLGRGEQAMVLLNRRGYARSLLCRGCGHVATCSECSVAMTYHRGAARLRCHYCGIERDVPSECPACGGVYIDLQGVGTEQLEEIVRARFPKSRMARVDSDSTRRRGSLRRILLDFARGDLDLLVGTQMLAKGHDFPNVTLVGVVSADGGLAFPDFRSAERTFQLLTQVAGRAGRGERPGRVVLQSFYPSHYALELARRQDYDGFFRREIEFRKLMGYPPASRLVAIVVQDRRLERALRTAERVAAVLRAGAAGSPVRLLGPAMAPIERLRGEYRCQILLKSPTGADPLAIVRDAFAELAARKAPMRSVRVDVDPLSLL